MISKITKLTTFNKVEWRTSYLQYLPTFASGIAGPPPLRSRTLSASGLTKKGLLLRANQQALNFDFSCPFICVIINM